MNPFWEGSKCELFSAEGLHCVNPFLVGSPPCRHSKLVPHWSVSSPKCLLYHSFILSGFRHLKKMPPKPVTFFISLAFFGGAHGPVESYNIFVLPVFDNPGNFSLFKLE